MQYAIALFQEEAEEAKMKPSDSHYGDTQTECKHRDNATKNGSSHVKSSHGVYNDAYDADINTRL